MSVESVTAGLLPVGPKEDVDSSGRLFFALVRRPLNILPLVSRQGPQAVPPSSR